MPRPAVVVSGHTMALAVVRALGENGVPVVILHHDPRDIAQASRYIAADIRVPHPVQNEHGFIEALIKAGQRLDGAILMPASDESTVAVSRHKALPGTRYVVACPDWDIPEQFIDKTRTYAVAERAGRRDSEDGDPVGAGRAGVMRCRDRLPTRA